ncbi:MAG: iron-containing redox enzyme family protein [Pseudomonadota bacterium]
MSLSSKDQWLDLLKNHKDKKTILTLFCKNYYFFSLHQIRAFSRIIKLFPAEDCNSLSLIASVVYDELGKGIPEKAHSYLFHKFALSVDSRIKLSCEDNQVVLGVKKYLNDLWDSFDGNSLPKALAAYVFLEETAVAFYPKILKILESCSFKSGDSLEFFYLHAILEVEHEKAANELVIQQNFSSVEQKIYNIQFEYLKRSWEVFWQDILSEARITLEAIDESTSKIAN